MSCLLLRCQASRPYLVFPHQLGQGALLCLDLRLVLLRLYGEAADLPWVGCQARVVECDGADRRTLLDGSLRERTLGAYLALAHNKGPSAALKTIRLRGLNWAAYKQRNPQRAASIGRYGDDVISGGSRWSQVEASSSSEDGVHQAA